MNKLVLKLLWLIPGVLTLLGAEKSLGQISIPPGAATYTQDFNALLSTGTPAWANNKYSFGLVLV